MIFFPIRLLAAILVGVSAATTMSLLLAMLFGTLTTMISAVSLGAGLVAGLLACRACRDRVDRQHALSSLDYLIIFFFTLSCFRQFFWLYFYKNGDLLTLNHHNLGDLPSHIQFINYFAKGARFWPELPYFVGEKFHYPFGMDLFGALFVGLGLPIGIVLPLTGFILAMVTLGALLYWGGGFTAAGFLFSGGVTGFAWLTTGTLKDAQATGALPWISLATTLLISQRGFLFAFPCGLLLLWSWRRRFVLQTSDSAQASQTLSSERPLPLPLEGFLWGTLPVFHVHTFIFLSALFAVWVVATRRFKEGFFIFLWAVVPATLEMVMLTDFFKKGGMFWVKWGWLMEDQNPFLFFMTQFGFLMFLLLFTLYDVVTKKKKEEALLLYPGLAFFSICFVVVFAVWIVDNMKLMVWCYLLILPVMGRVFAERVRPPWQIPVYGVFFFTGFLAVFGQYHSSNGGVGIATMKEVNGVCEATKDLPVSGRFATVQTYNHPVALCGHPLVAGYAGHLGGLGLDSAVQTEQLRRLMMGDPAWQDLSVSLQAHYLFWGSREQQEYPASTRPWEREAVRIAQGGWGTIYDLSSRP